MALSKAEIAARFGTALFDYAEDMAALDTVHADMQELAEAISNYPQILKFLATQFLIVPKKRNRFL